MSNRIDCVYVVVVGDAKIQQSYSSRKKDDTVDVIVRMMMNSVRLKISLWCLINFAALLYLALAYLGLLLAWIRASVWREGRLRETTKIFSK